MNEIKKGMITGVILLIISLIITFQFIGNSAPTLTDAADNISGSGFPLANLFSPGGAVLLLFMGFIVLIIIGLIFEAKHLWGR